jgi:hypothetical protein
MAKLLSRFVGRTGTVVPKNEGAVKTFFADLNRNSAMYGVGVALLHVQITHLENRCIAMRGHLGQKRCLTR